MGKLTGGTAMTPEQLAAIAARNAARTQGKWKAAPHGETFHLQVDGVWHAELSIGYQFKSFPYPEEAAAQFKKDAAFIAHASEDIPSLLAEVARLTAVIEHDRSKVVDVLAEANAVLKNYGWLAEGRGSYAFDDDRWKDEFKVCMDSLAKVLDPMRGIASDLSDSPIKWADIVAARSMTDALAEAEKRIAEAACDVVDAYSEFDRPYCCDGRMCGCQGQSVHDMMKHFIRAMVRS